MDLLVNGNRAQQLCLRLDGVSPGDLVAIVQDEAGLGSMEGEPWIDPGRLYDRMVAASERLARAPELGQTVLLATGHPVGVLYLYMSIASELERAGAIAARPAEGSGWDERPSPSGSRAPSVVAKRLVRAALSGRVVGRAHRRLAYVGGVATVTDGRSALHTHSGTAMEYMLAEVRPSLVIADHELAGTAITSGIETIAVADVNDPALMVAHRLGQVEHVLVMEDNAAPEAYWPCFQVLTQSLQGRPSSSSPDSPA